jgi:hypothetical protein
MRINLSINLLLIGFALVLLTGCATLNVSGTGNKFDEKAPSPRTFLKAEVTNQYGSFFIGKSAPDSIYLRCKVNLMYDKSFAHASVIDSVFLQSRSTPFRFDFTKLNSSKSSWENYGYDQNNHSITRMTDTYTYKHKAKPARATLSRKLSEFWLIVKYRLIGIGGTEYPYSDSLEINLNSVTDYGQNNNMMMNRQMMAPHF